jgi:4-aminobutyrate--pyruvate transaminase
MVLESAEGVYITDNQGKQYLEGMSGLWCTAIGYGQEELAKVAYEQMCKLNYSQLFAGRTNEPSVLLADKLKKMVPFDAGRVFFGLSGSDANDTQIKLIWYYNNAIGRPEKKKIISRKRGYHGVTIASGSLTGLAPLSLPAFDLPMPGVLHTTSPHHYSEGLPGRTQSAFVQRLVDDLEKMIEAEGPETVGGLYRRADHGRGRCHRAARKLLPTHASGTRQV